MGGSGARGNAAFACRPLTSESFPREIREQERAHDPFEAAHSRGITLMGVLVAMLIFTVVFLVALGLYQVANRAYLRTDAATISSRTSASRWTALRKPSRRRRELQHPRRDQRRRRAGGRGVGSRVLRPRRLQQPARDHADVGDVSDRHHRQWRDRRLRPPQAGRRRQQHHFPDDEDRHEHASQRHARRHDAPSARRR